MRRPRQAEPTRAEPPTLGPVTTGQVGADSDPTELESAPID
jgi:hypothetical protein